MAGLFNGGNHPSESTADPGREVEEKPKEKSFYLQKMIEQTPEMCLTAVQQNGYALAFVQEQTSELCLAAVQQNGYALQFVKEQTPEICLAAIAYEKQGSNLESSHRYLLEYNYFLKDENEEIHQHVDPEFIFPYVREQTPEICLAAVKEYGAVLEYVKEQTEEVCLAAVQENGYALKFVQEQTGEICLAAVQQDGYALQFVKEQTPEICSAAVEHYADSLRFVQEQTEEMCLAAVQQDGYALKFVKEQTPEICNAAVEQYADAVKYIKNSVSDNILQTENSKVLTNAENNPSNPSVAIPCHNPVTGQIYTQAKVIEHQQQNQSDDARYLPPQEIDKLGMTIKEGAKPVVNTYSKENEAGQPAQHFEMLFNGKDIKGLPPLKIITEKLSIGIAKVKESIQNIGNKTIQRNAKENDGGGYEM